jgi:hypothetical protein
MANVRIQPGNALEVFPSDNANVPFPAVNVANTVSALVTNQLVDSTKNFVNLAVYAGDIVYCSKTQKAATVLNNASSATPTVLLLNNDIFTTIGDDYTIYQSSPQAGGQNTGCVLYVGTAGDLVVTTTSNNTVVFRNIQDGSFIPVQVLKVWEAYTFPTGSVATSAQNIVALW